MIGTVNLVDRPAAAIAVTAVKKTAEIYSYINPEAAEKIIDDTYIDDTVTGIDDRRKLEALIEAIKTILAKGGFPVKGFVVSGDVSKEALALLGSGEMGRVLGIAWDPGSDSFRVLVRINVSKKHKAKRVDKDLEYDEIPSILDIKMTKRLLLSMLLTLILKMNMLKNLNVKTRIK